MTKKIISVVLVLMMALAFVSCDGNILKKNKEKKEYKTVNSVILPMSPVRTLNPAATIDEDTYFISKLVYDSLFILDEHMVPKGSLAKNYSFNAGEKSLTIDLIETTWQDGEALTGEDVAFTINAYKKAGEACQYNSTVSKIDYVNASGNQVTIFFYEKNNMAIDMLTFPIIPEHGFKSTAEAIKGDGAFIPMGSGQYKCDSYNATDKLVLAPNENYHGEKAINTLTFEVMPGKENAYKLLETSGISLMISKAMDRETEIRNKSIKIENFPMNEVEFLGFNFYRESLKKPEVRKAIASAVNSESIIEECYYNSGIVNDNLYFPNYMNVDSKQAAYTYDLQKASEYLKDAGYKEDATDGLLRDKNKNVLSMTILVNQTNEARVASAESIKRALTGIGISVTVKAVDDAEYTSSLQKGEFDLYLGAYKYDEQMDMRILFGDSTYNYTGYQNKKLMELMNDMRSGASEETVKKDFEEIRKILIEDLPYVTLLYKTYGAIKAPALQGEVNPVFNNLYRDCGKWQCKYEVMPKAEEEKTK